MQITEPQVLGAVTPATPLSAIVINRNQLASNSVEAFLANQTDVTIKFQTGAVKHTALVGMELDREDSDPTRPRYTGVPTTSLLAPDDMQPFAGVAAINTNVHARSNSAAAYVIDTAKFGSHWELNGSFRFDRFNSHYTQAVPPVAAFNRLDHLPSWRGAVIYKPVTPVSIYVSAGNSFNPSAESLSLSASTVSLPPEENRTYEVGAKWDLARPGLSLRTALFQTDKLNAREPDPTNSLLNVLAGKQRVQGFQADMSGHLSANWDAQIGYAYLDATLRSSNFYPAAVGARLANVPAHTLTFWQTYRLPSSVPHRCRRQLRRRSNCQFHRAHRAYQRARQAGSRLLGLQCDGRASGYRTRHPARQRLQSGRSLLLRSVASLAHRTRPGAQRSDRHPVPVLTRNECCYPLQIS